MKAIGLAAAALALVAAGDASAGNLCRRAR
jgi:hypothetical protein